MSRLWILASCLVLVLAACESSGPTIEIDNAWVRPDPLMENAAGFLIIRNVGSEPDTLIRARVDFARGGEVHESIVEDGIHRMEAIERLEIPAGGETELRPMGYHVMIMGLEEPLTVGDTVTFVLEFERAGDITVEAEIRQQ